MKKTCERFVTAGIFRMSEDKIRENYKEHIGILYGFNNYECNLEHIKELKNIILNDYPDTKDEDIEVWFIENYQSDIHARHTMLRVMVSVEDFIKLRNNRKIHIL